MTDESLYYDHYKDSFSLQQGYLGERNKLTVWLLILLVLVAGFIYDPALLNEKVNTYVECHVKGLAVEFKYLNTGVIFLLLWVVTRYYQLVLLIEKMYNYISECETRLSKDNNYIINREGAYYLKSYPWLKDVLDFSYVVLLPLAIIATAVVKIINELSWTTNFKWVDFVGLGLIIFFSLLYLSNRKLKEEFFDKEQYPNMKFFPRLWCYFGLKKHK